MIPRRGASLDELEALYRSRFDVFVRIAASVTGDSDHARDAVQDGFAAAVRRRGSFRGDGPLEAWVWRIVLNAARSDARRPVPAAELNDRAVTNGHPERDAELRAALARLPERQRIAVFLRYYADLDYADDRQGTRDRRRDGRGDPQRGAHRAPKPTAGGQKVTDLDRASIDRVLPATTAPADWEDVLRRSGAHRARRRLVRVVLVSAAAVVLVAGAASAFGTVRELFLGTGVNSKIAFMHNTRKNCCPHELWVMDADGSNPLQVARDVTGAAAWSPDERQIVYWQAARRGSRGNKIYVVRQDGSGRRLLTRSGLSPSWSPDGQRIVFMSWRDRNWEIYVMNAGGGKHRNLTRNAGPDSNPVWSPDGRRIAFGSERDGNLEIYVMNADGSDQRNLTRSDGVDSNPVWSPDGRRIAFGSERRWQLGDVPRERGWERPAKPHPGRLESAAWSPDGQRIAFISRRSGLAEIHVMNADGSDQRSLKARVHRHSGLGWSPDGTKIAYNLSEGGAEVYVVNADGSGRKRLTRSPWANWFVGWSPGPKKGR